MGVDALEWNLRIVTKNVAIYNSQLQKPNIGSKRFWKESSRTYTETDDSVQIRRIILPYKTKRASHSWSPYNTQTISRTVERNVHKHTSHCGYCESEQVVALRRPWGYDEDLNSANATSCQFDGYLHSIRIRAFKTTWYLACHPGKAKDLVVESKGNEQWSNIINNVDIFPHDLTSSIKYYSIAKNNW